MTNKGRRTKEKTEILVSNIGLVGVVLGVVKVMMVVLVDNVVYRPTEALKVRKMILTGIYLWLKIRLIEISLRIE